MTKKRAPLPMRSVICMHCGNAFETNGTNAKRCQECRKIFKKANSQEMQVLKRLLSRQARVERSSKLLAQDNAKAKEMGLSYGEYQALKALGKVD